MWNRATEDRRGNGAAPLEANKRAANMDIRGAVMKMIKKILNTKSNLQDVVFGEKAVKDAERITMKVLDIRRGNIPPQRRSNSEPQPNRNH
jgi:hypothetical protein